MDHNGPDGWVHVHVQWPPLGRCMCTLGTQMDKYMCAFRVQLGRQVRTLRFLLGRCTGTLRLRLRRHKGRQAFNWKVGGVDRAPWLDLPTPQKGLN